MGKHYSPLTTPPTIHLQTKLIATLVLLVGFVKQSGEGYEDKTQYDAVKQGFNHVRSPMCNKIGSRPSFYQIQQQLFYPSHPHSPLPTPHSPLPNLCFQTQSIAYLIKNF